MVLFRGSLKYIPRDYWLFHPKNWGRYWTQRIPTDRIPSVSCVATSRAIKYSGFFGGSVNTRGSSPNGPRFNSKLSKSILKSRDRRWIRRWIDRFLNGVRYEEITGCWTKNRGVKKKNKMDGEKKSWFQTLLKWMIWGFSPIFLETPNYQNNQKLHGLCNRVPKTNYK